MKTIVDYFCKILYIKKYLIVIGLNLSGPKPWQSLKHSRSPIPEKFERVDSGSITFVQYENFTGTILFQSGA